MEPVIIVEISEDGPDAVSAVYAGSPVRVVIADRRIRRSGDDTNQGGWVHEIASETLDELPDDIAPHVD